MSWVELIHFNQNVSASVGPIKWVLSVANLGPPKQNCISPDQWLSHNSVCPGTSRYSIDLRSFLLSCHFLQENPWTRKTTESEQMSVGFSVGWHLFQYSSAKGAFLCKAARTKQKTCPLPRNQSFPSPRWVTLPGWQAPSAPHFPLQQGCLTGQLQSSGWSRGIRTRSWEPVWCSG